MQIKEYADLNYVSIELQDNECIPEYNATYQRISIPSGKNRFSEMHDKGYRLVDRTIGVKVPLCRSKIDFKKFCRMDVFLSGDKKGNIRNMAEKYFQQDFRFQVTFSNIQKKLAMQIIDAWIAEQDNYYQCCYNGELAGFADVRCLPEYDGMPFMYLAATEEKYRGGGTAMSLYAAVFQHYKEAGAAFAYGRISSGNMPSMNLYAKFGAQFAAPYDIYIKI